jgi:hypothetical protein
METSLDDLLNGKAAEPVQADAAPEPTPETVEAPDGPVRDDQGRFAAETGVEPQETVEPVPPTDRLPQDEYKALREEREKRQRLEADIEALKQQLQPKEPPPPPPSLWEDEKGWQDHQQQVILRQADQLSRINASEMAARGQFPDFQEKFDLFNQIAAENPAVVQQAMGDPHPWRKAYEIAKNHAEIKELGATNLDELKAKIREELMAEVQAKPVGVPPTLTGERNVGARSGPSWSGPKPLSELLA